jgi:hypothetical protein
MPTWSVGQVLTASDVNTWLVPLAVYKTADQFVASSTALVNDTELLLPVAASAVYRFECWLHFIATTAVDIKWTWTVPSGASLTYSPLHNEGGGVGFNNSANIYADTDTITGAGSSPQLTAVVMKGRLITGSASGTLQLRWAQATSNAAATHVRSGSYIELRRHG